MLTIWHHLSLIPLQDAITCWTLSETGINRRNQTDCWLYDYAPIAVFESDGYARERRSRSFYTT